MKTTTGPRTRRPDRPALHGLHSFQGRHTLERALARAKHRLGHPRFIEAPGR